jgi:hypothetical protein
VLKYRSDGAGYWFQRCASQPAKPPGGPAAIAVDSANNAYIAGAATSTSYFGATNYVVSAGGNDTFLAKLGVYPPALTQPRANLLVVAGSNALLQVSGATGTGPLGYQWQLNGANIAGATGTSLALSNFAFDRAGRYSIRITSPSGSTTGQVAAVGFIPVLTAVPGAGSVVLTWSGTFTLQSATNVRGPYSDWTSAASPFTNVLAEAQPQRFFRLRVSDPSLSGTMQSNAFEVSITGSPGRLYLVQASTNLVDWIPLETDASPFTLQDSNATGLPQRFYRARLVP